jgi:hypothetical protein
MQSININLTLGKSLNGLVYYAPPFPSIGKWIALPQSTDVALAIPGEVNGAIFSFSAGATVAIAIGPVGQTISAPSSSFTQTYARINAPSAQIQQYDDNNIQQYLHFFSPNPSDWVQVGFYVGEPT